MEIDSNLIRAIDAASTIHKEWLIKEAEYQIKQNRKKAADSLLKVAEHIALLTRAREAKE